MAIIQKTLKSTDTGEAFSKYMQIHLIVNFTPLDFITLCRTIFKIEWFHSSIRLMQKLPRSINWCALIKFYGQSWHEVVPVPCSSVQIHIG